MLRLVILCLQEHKSKVTQLEERVSEVKKHYSYTLQRLEKISEEIHAQRGPDQCENGSTKSFKTRSPPVGAEAVVTMRTEGGRYGGRDKSNEWVDGHEAKTQEWVERRRESGWWDGEKQRPVSGVGSDSNSVFSFKTIASDLEKCDSVEHLGQMSDSVSLSGEEEERGKEGGYDEIRRVKQEKDKKLDFTETETQEQPVKQHHRSVSL